MVALSAEVITSSTCIGIADIYWEGAQSSPTTWWHARHQHRQLVQAAHPLSLLPATSPLTLMLPRKSTNTRITFSLSLTSPIRKSIGRPSGRTNRFSFINVGFLVETSVMEIKLSMCETIFDLSYAGKGGKSKGVILCIERVCTHDRAVGLQEWTRWTLLILALILQEWTSCRNNS